MCQVDGTEGVQPTARRSCEVHKTENRKLGEEETKRAGGEPKAAAGSCPPYEVRLVNVYFRPPFFAAITAQGDGCGEGEEGEAGPGNQ